MWYWRYICCGLGNKFSSVCVLHFPINFSKANISEERRRGGKQRKDLRGSYPIVVSIDLVVSKVWVVTRVGQWVAHVPPHDHVHPILVDVLGLLGVVPALYHPASAPFSLPWLGSCRSRLAWCPPKLPQQQPDTKPCQQANSQKFGWLPVAWNDRKSPSAHRYPHNDLVTQVFFLKCGKIRHVSLILHESALY